MSTSGKKISQLTELSSIIATAILAVVQNGKTYFIKFQNFLANYYTKDEIDTKLANLEIGGVPWQEKTFEDVEIEANTVKVITHNLNNINFRWEFLEYNVTYGKYLDKNWKPTVADRTANTISLISTADIEKCKLIFFG